MAEPHRDLLCRALIPHLLGEEPLAQRITDVGRHDRLAPLDVDGIGPHEEHSPAGDEHDLAVEQRVLDEVLTISHDEADGYLAAPDEAFTYRVAWDGETATATFAGLDA